MTDKTVEDLRTGSIIVPDYAIKVALCLSGKLRNFRHTAEFMRRYVIEPLNADVFFFGSNSRLSDTDEEDLVSLLQPKKYKIHNEQLYIDPEYSRHKRSESNPTAIVYQAFNILNSNKLKKEYETENLFKYDVTICCRMDCFFTRSFTEDELKSAKLGEILMPSGWHFKEVNSFAVSDMFAMSDSATMDVYSGLYNCLPNYKSKCIIHPESLMGHHLINENRFTITDMKDSPFVFEYPADWIIPPGYNRENYRQYF